MNIESYWKLNNMHWGRVYLHESGARIIVQLFNSRGFILFPKWHDVMYMDSHACRESWRSMSTRQSKTYIKQWVDASRTIDTVCTMSCTSYQIVKILEEKLLSIRMDSKNEMYYQCGRARLLSQVEQCVNEKKPIRFLLPAFPCKSPNIAKVSGTLPDAAEYYALQHLDDTAAEIAALHGLSLIHIWRCRRRG